MSERLKVTQSKQVKNQRAFGALPQSDSKIPCRALESLLGSCIGSQLTMIFWSLLSRVASIFSGFGCL